MSDYPVGATWQAVDRLGKTVRILLEHRNQKGYEVWLFTKIHADGSKATNRFGVSRFTVPSYYLARKRSIGFLHKKDRRMKRIA